MLKLIDNLLVQVDKPWYNYYLPLGVYHMFSNLSTFRENANNEESDQTGLLGGGGGGLLMDQSNPCFYTKGDLTKPHLATRSNIFSNVCAKSLTCIEAILLHHFFFKGIQVL